jgi:hypothetical protein
MNYFASWYTFALVAVDEIDRSLSGGPRAGSGTVIADQNRFLRPGPGVTWAFTATRTAPP